MEEGEEKEFVCEFCNKTFSSAQARGGHISIHYSKKKNSDRYNSNKKKSLVLVGPREKPKQEEDDMMDEGNEKKFACGFCNREFASAKALGGHIKIHYSNKNSVDSDRYNSNKKKSLVGGQREKQKQQQDCTICGKKFVSLKALEDHMACHSERDAILVDNQSDTDSETRRKRSKRVMRRSNSESFSNERLSFSGVDHDIGVVSYALMMAKSGEDSSYKERHNFVMNSMKENFGVVKTKSSSGKKLIKIYDLKSQVTEADKVAEGSGQLTSADGVILCDSDSSYSDSDTPVDGSRRNTGFGSGFNNSLKRFRSGVEGGSKYETDSCADTNSKIHRFGDSKSPMVKKAGGEEKESKSSDTDDE